MHIYEFKGSQNRSCNNWGRTEEQHPSPVRTSRIHDNVYMPYWVALQYAELPSLSDRRDKLCRDFSANCLIHVIAFIICCHPLVTLKSHLGLEKQPHILDPVTVLTATNLIHHALLKYQ